MSRARYVIYGAGGVGASLGAQLHQAGHDVALIARGDHLRAIQESGLRYRTPLGSADLEIAAFEHPRDADLSDRDVLILAMKTQDTLAAILGLQSQGLQGVRILCAQNGVHNERLALRRFPNVYGLAVWIPASFVEPGIVSNYAVNAPLDLGRIPCGPDASAQRIAEDLGAAGFDAVARDRVLDWKYSKLLMNIQTTVDAICGSREGLADVCSEIREEAEACYAKAGIEVAPHAEHVERLKAAAHAMGEIDGVPRAGGSSTQSLQRGMGSIETDYINGEIVLLGRQCGVSTPANVVVQRLANDFARRGSEAIPIEANALRAQIARARSGADSR
jgi:2-dehydropantoate 2-reductase